MMTFLTSEEMILLALELCTEIAQACHRELPPVTIYQARTIATLAALLEQPTALKFPALVHLKKGAKRLRFSSRMVLAEASSIFFKP
jgi:hypothetical protein